MDILRRTTSVELTRLPVSAADTLSDVVFPWQSLCFRLAMVFNNEGGKYDKDGRALMVAVGESNFVLMWRKLFNALCIAPVVVDGSDTQHKLNAESGSLHTSTSSSWCTYDPTRTGTLGKIAGKLFVVTAKCVCEGATLETTAPTSGEVEESGQGKETPIPRRIECVYDFHYTLPDFDIWGNDVTIGFLVMSHYSGNGNVDFVRSLDPTAARVKNLFKSPTVVLGTCHYRAVVSRLLRCTSVARQISSTSVMICVNVANVAHVPVRVQEVSFDIYSTQMGEGDNDIGGVQLTHEQRFGPCGTDLKAIKLLQRTVTVTPLLLHGRCLEETLQPGESACFQFAIEVQPHLCHLLETHPRQEPHSRYANNTASVAVEAKNAPYSMRNDVSPILPHSPVAPQTVWRPSPIGTVECVPCSELKQVLFSKFVSQAYVSYNPIVSAGGESTDQRVASPACLTIRHSVPWSMLATRLAT
ncbi:hypothetical protein DPX39_080029100 [Trypanosoma brucei equiperdum]|uniref:Uncharacterized protein n=1 Tax=Trypanosoma brucei equiperdum TaxID=630700 RepID=A0A3L6L7C8_9TRYP|nr:hypothetical protein DPX39_080029100 [Trypanosoma brucei equiperdum]